MGITLHYKPAQLFFKQPFKIAHGSRTYTSIVIIKLVYENIYGFGEASLPPYLNENQESVMTFLEKCKPLLSTFDSKTTINDFLLEIDQIAPGNTAAKAAIDIAIHDLKGKLEKKACYELFDTNGEKTPFTSFTIGIDSIEGVIAKTRSASSYKFLKVKLNGENDKEIIQAIRSVSNQPLSIDVNQGWKEKEYALKMIEWLYDKNVVLIEQPLSKNAIDDSFWLFERSPLPIIADESVQRLNDIESTKNYFHGINIKLMKCTGLNEAMKMINRCRELNLKILLGCMSESSCAVSAAAHLSPFVDYADLDAPLLITNDFFNGIEFHEGKITLPLKYGIGADLKEELF